MEVTNMAINTKYQRLSIDMFPEEHRKIKTHAALRGESIREYVLETIRERLRMEEEQHQLSAMTAKIGSVMTELWENEKDSAYDKI